MTGVLVVDDDALMRGLFTEWLSEAGYRVRQAGNGASALKMRRGQPVGQPIADMDMPGRDGVRTLDEERLKPPGLSVIATSGGAYDEIQDWTATVPTLGAVKALAKSFDRRDLMAKVEKVGPRDESGAVQS